MRDYTGKEIFVGIDVHKKSYSVVSICEGKVIKKDRLVANPQGLLDYIKKFFPGALVKSGYEAGFSGFGLHRLLCAHGIENKVVHAASIEIAARDRVKTDKRDALKIAVQLHDGRLRGIFVPTEARESYRRVSRWRDQLVEDRKRIGNRLKSLLYLAGQLGPEEEAKVSLKWIKSLDALSLDKSTQYVINQLRRQWMQLSESIKEVNIQLKRQAEEDQSLEAIYRSAPGVGETIARVLSNELGDLKHFRNEKALFSYTGLTPSEHSSGEYKRLGHISRQGKSILRKVLIQAAWIAIREDKSLANVFERIAKSAGVKRAIVAVARHLIGRIRACFIAGELYCYAR